MKHVEMIPKKVVTIKEAQSIIAGWKLLGKTVGFTNGCFDILHPGHIYSLSQTAKEADYLIVGLNSDESVKKLKGPSRPINNQNNRKYILESLKCVNEVAIFNEDTPLNIIKKIKPNIIVKGGDYNKEQVVGYGLADVMIFNYLDGYSTTSIIKNISNR